MSIQCIGHVQHDSISYCIALIYNISSASSIVGFYFIIIGQPASADTDVTSLRNDVYFHSAYIQHDSMYGFHYI